MPNNRMFWMHAVTPVHVGTGAQIGFIDLPIAREKTTAWPLVPGSGIKGVIAERFDASDPVARAKDALLVAAFGRADDAASEQANSGALVFTDARLVCLPVRSVFGTFAWATCAMALKRLSRDLEDAGLPLPAAVPAEPGAKVLTPEKSALKNATGHVYLADLDFEAVASKEAAAWATAIGEWLFPGDKEWAAIFQQRFVILDGDTFQYFADTGTEITTRVRIDPATKTVATGQLWTEEALPAEAVLAGLVWCDKIFMKERKALGKDEAGLLQHFCGKPLSLQVGGKATVGRGRVRVSFSSAPQ
jgi:CRISPR-associated protein Cmr4